MSQASSPSRSSYGIPSSVFCILPLSSVVWGEERGIAISCEQAGQLVCIPTRSLSISTCRPQCGQQNRIFCGHGNSSVFRLDGDFVGAVLPIGHGNSGVFRLDGDFVGAVLPIGHGNSGVFTLDGDFVGTAMPIGHSDLSVFRLNHNFVGTMLPI